MLRAWGVERPDDQFEILARSGGARATDRIELAEYRPEDDPLALPLEFRLAGGKHCDPIELRPGDRVEFERDRENPRDVFAVKVMDTERHKAGYVPVYYAKMFSRLLDAGEPIASEAVRRLSVLDDGGRWVIRATRRT
jgi:hypothetical protein